MGGVPDGCSPVPVPYPLGFLFHFSGCRLGPQALPAAACVLTQPRVTSERFFRKPAHAHEAGPLGALCQPCPTWAWVQRPPQPFPSWWGGRGRLGVSSSAFLSWPTCFHPPRGAVWQSLGHIPVTCTTLEWLQHYKTPRDPPPRFLKGKQEGARSQVSISPHPARGRAGAGPQTLGVFREQLLCSHLGPGPSTASAVTGSACAAQTALLGARLCPLPPGTGRRLSPQVTPCRAAHALCPAA